MNASSNIKLNTTKVWHSSIDIEAIRTVFNLFFFYEENSKHLKHKQNASKLTFNQIFVSKQKH